MIIRGQTLLCDQRLRLFLRAQYILIFLQLGIYYMKIGIHLVAVIWATILVLCLTTGLHAETAKKLNIDFERNADFLPYVIEKLRYTNQGVQSRPIWQPAQVYRRGYPGSENEMFIEAFNKELNADAPSSFIYYDAREEKIISQINIYYTITEYRVLLDKEGEGEGIIAGCYHNDSAFVFRHYLATDQRDFIYLTSGIDQTGDGEWVPGISPWAMTDYDYDDKTEVFFYVNPSFDKEPRALYCIEPESLHVEWSMPLACHIIGRPLSCRDSLNPSVILITYGPQNGVKDKNFDDRFGYIVKVNNRGKILFKKIVSKDFRGPAIIRKAGSDSLFYLYHPLPFVDPDSTDSLPKDAQLLSIIDRDCNILQSVPVGEELDQLWLCDYTGDNSLELYTKSTTGVIRIYDDKLHLLAESNRTNFGRFANTIKLAGQNNPAFVLSTPAKSTDIYSYDMQKLASYGETFTRYEPLTFDAFGNVSKFILSHQNKFLVANIKKQRLSDYIQIVFWKYREYILMVLSALVVGLIVVNHYRRKTKSNLNLIARQKKELERVHQELKNAQAKIIAQEKYRQAKDIAGGVAHEIHNALCPALNSLDKLRQRLDSLQTSDTKRNTALLDLTQKAITRAVNMTELVKAYSRLESEKRSEPVPLKEILDEVVEANKFRIQSLGVSVQIDVPDGCTISCAKPHAFSLFNNLMLNALDALAEMNRRGIIISARYTNKALEIEFSDTGVGIPPENLERIFDAFFSTKLSTGTGLGLSMVKKIVELYDGTIRVESELDKGTKFIILFSKNS